MNSQTNQGQTMSWMQQRHEQLRAANNGVLTQAAINQDRRDRGLTVSPKMLRIAAREKK